MQENVFPDGPMSAQPTDVLTRKVDRMEDLQPRPTPSPTPPTPAEQTPATAPVAGTAETEIAEARQEETEARTVRYAIGKLNDFLQWFVAVLEVTLAVRFLLRLIGADPNNLFAGFVYALTDIVLVPFSNIVHSPSLRANEAFEWSTLIAMAMYWLIFWAIRRFLRILISGPEEAPS